MSRLFLFTVAALAALGLLTSAEEAPVPPRSVYPPVLPGAEVEMYKEIDGVKLNLWLFRPAKPAAPGEKRPAIVFFFGGGWTAGTPQQFERQARHFAERGMVALVADYRVASRNQVKPAACVADAKSCLRWIRTNADLLGIDPKHLAAAGGSAGGHLAAATALLPGLDEPGEKTDVSPVPNALILFNPALVLAPFGGLTLKGFEQTTTQERFGCAPEAISPIHHVHADLPPTIIFHGRADTTVPYASAEAFTAEMKKAGNRCELIGYEGQTHGFFNGAKYDETLAEADKFLVGLGWIKAEAKGQ